MTPTDEQQAIISQATSMQSCIIEAYAGTAKTTTLTLAAQRIGAPALALAFNKKIATELANKLPPNFQVKTMNALGHGIWARALPPSTRITVEGNKLSKIVTSLAKEQRLTLTDGQWVAVRDIVSAAMLRGVVPLDEGRPLTPNTPELWQSLALDEFVIEQDLELVIELAQEVLRRSVELSRAGTISFDDQVYCPVVLGGKWPQFPIAFGDEVQDWNALNHAALALATRADAKLVLVGDSRQSIYAFRGADSASMKTVRRLRPQLDGWTDLGLTMTFRCPKVVVRRQQGHAPGFRAWDGCVEGSHQHFAGTDNVAGAVFSWNFQTLRGLRPGNIAILCRNNAPLLSLAFKLIRRGIGPQMLGRDIGRGLTILAKKIIPEDAKAGSIPQLIEEWQASELSRSSVREDTSKQDSIRDRAECLLAVAEGAQGRDRADLLAALSNLFERQHGDVMLGTGHRAKGMEWDVVLHLDPWRVPSKQAKLSGGEAMQQELNLKYVIETRTRDVLAEADLQDFH